MCLQTFTLPTPNGQINIRISHQIVSLLCWYIRHIPTNVINIYTICAWWRHQMETFPRYMPFVRGIHRSHVNSPHKGQRRGALMFSLICAWINGWVNNRDTGDLRHHRTHYDATVMDGMFCHWTTLTSHIFLRILFKLFHVSEWIFINKKMAWLNCHKIFPSNTPVLYIAHVNIAVLWHLKSNNICTRSPAGTILLEILSLFIDICVSRCFGACWHLQAYRFNWSWM